MKKYTISFDKSQKELIDFSKKISFEGNIKIKCLQVHGNYNCNVDSLYLSDRFIRKVKINDYLTYFVYMLYSDDYNELKDIISKIDLLNNSSKLELGTFIFNFPNSILWKHLDDYDRYQLLKYNDDINDYNFTSQLYNKAINFYYDYETISFEFYYQSDNNIPLETIYDNSNINVENEDIEDIEYDYINENLEVKHIICV